MNKQVILRSGLVVEVEENAQSFKCKDPRCTKRIVFARTINKKIVPITQDEKGEWYTHFEDCPGAKTFRRRKT